MEIIRRHDALTSKKSEGTEVLYYIFPEYEIHYNEMPPGTMQQWHHHNVLEETVYVISGSLEFHWIDNNTTRSQTLNAGDIVRVEKESHTLENRSTSLTTFLVIRLVLNGKDNRGLFINDKVMDPVKL